MKFGAATKLLLAFAWLGTSEGSNSTILTPLLRGRHLQEAAGDSAGGTAAGGATAGGTAPAGDARDGGGAAAGTSATAASGQALPKVPVKKLKYGIGGGQYSGIKVVNNVGYAFMGYDIVKGNPLDTSGIVKVDEGFRNPIFTVPDENAYELLVDRQYYAPANLNVVECEGCNMHATTKVIDTMKDYVGSLNTKVGFDAKFNAGAVTGAFSGSFDYKQATEKMSKEHETSTQSEISCCVYQAELQDYNLPPFSKNFLQGLSRLKEAAAKEDKGTERTRLLASEEADVLKKRKSLPEGPLKDEIERFVKSFGTHAVKKVTMGSLYGEQTFISQKDKREMEEKGYNIALAAGLNVAKGAFEAGVNFELDRNKKQTEEFSQKTSKRSVYARGAKPPGDGDMQLWLAYSSDNPVPTHIEVAPICELDVFKKEGSLYQALKTYTQNYCFEVKGADCGSLSADGVAIKTMAEEEAGFSDFRGKHQPKINVPDTKDFEHNQNYDTKDTEIIIGLAGTFANDHRKFQAIVSTIGENPTMHSHKTGSVGWSQWSGYDTADLTCGDNEAVVGIKSHIGLSKDRKWGLNCATIQGMKISKLSVDPKSGLSMIDAKDASKLDFVHEHHKSFKYHCPLNHVVVGLYSYRDWAKTNDLSHLKVKCALMTPATRQVDGVSVTPLWNELRKPFFYSAPSRVVLKGLLGDYSPSEKDDRYRFAELWLPQDATTLASTWTQSVAFKQVDTTDPKPQEFTCGGQALVGMSSFFPGAQTLGEKGMVRNFNFECRSIGAHRLQHADGRTVRDGSEFNEKDWSPGWAGKGASFGLECPDKKVLGGVKVLYDARQDAYGWKALCLFFIHN